MDQPEQQQPSAPPIGDHDDLRAVLNPIWDRKWMILLVVVAATVGAYFWADNKPRVFKASTTIFTQASELEQALFGSSIVSTGDDRAVLNQATLLTTSDTARAVARRIGFDGDPRALLAGVSTRARQGQDFIDITVRDGDPQRAARLANEFAEAFIALRSETLRDKVSRARVAAEQELERIPQSEATASAREDLVARIRQLRAVEALPSGTASQVQRAVAPGYAVEPRPKRIAAFAFALSLLFAIVAAFGLHRLDRRIRHLDEVESLYQAPLLGILPRVADASPSDGSHQAIPQDFHESLRSLRTNIELSTLDTTGVRLIIATSAVPGEGKSTIIRNLALVYAESGLRVAVVEGDVRRPVLARAFGVSAVPGLTDVLAGTSLASALKPVELGSPQSNGAGLGRDRTSGGEIVVIPAGPEPPNPPGVLGSERMSALLALLRDRFVMVLVDMDSTNREAARRVSVLTSRVPDASVLGIVANDVTHRGLGGSYAYYGYAEPRRRWRRRRR
jgi:polysaccharide biosynthesis transport protein